MKGVVFLGNKTLEVRDIPKPKPGNGEVLIEMKASGICGSDLLHYNAAVTGSEASINTVRGHEPCGVIAELGPGTRNVEVGQRVMIHHYRGCGKCKNCLSGWPQLCTKGTEIYGWQLNGGHEDFMVCTDAACVPMPDELTFEEGACCTCGTGTAFQALKRLSISGMDTFAIFGQGPVGISATILAKAMGARVIAVDTIDSRLESSKRVGADEIVNAGKVDAVAAIQKMTKGEGADATLDCTGVEAGRLNTLKSAKTWGRAGFVGLGPSITLDLSQLVIRKQLTVFGSQTFSTLVLAELGNFIVDHKVKLKETISDRYPLSEADAAYKKFARGETDKAVFIWE